MAHVHWIFPLKMVIFHGYVKEPEGSSQNWIIGFKFFSSTSVHKWQDRMISRKGAPPVGYAVWHAITSAGRHKTLCPKKGRLLLIVC